MQNAPHTPYLLTGAAGSSHSRKPSQCTTVASTDAAHASYSTPPPSSCRKTPLLSQLFLWLSRACLGRLIGVGIKMAQKRRFPHLGPSPVTNRGGGGGGSSSPGGWRRTHGCVSHQRTDRYETRRRKFERGIMLIAIDPNCQQAQQRPLSRC